MEYLCVRLLSTGATRAVNTSSERSYSSRGLQVCKRKHSRWLSHFTNPGKKQVDRNDELLKTDFFHYVVREHPEYCTIMHKWILTWILPTLFNRSYFYIIFLVGALSLACNDMNPEQMATNVNCSSPERHTRSYDYMEGGNVRVRRLFCRTQWYVKIDKRGKIKGGRDLNNNYSILEIRTVAVGIVAIKGVAMCNEDCNFIELIQENHYNTYASANWTHKGKEMYIALKQNGAPKRGQKTSKEDTSSHFLPFAVS
ncbi:Keratinocyte growth factor [Ophiophagus hannah]|uniref:Fibroblast growth factor n=1 Tax=Ophiophagus hannah TaxID=8665 RepID=V8NM89_OPHHA|nr:Keratinocyte growth factor [Ophiophagus hannah]